MCGIAGKLSWTLCPEERLVRKITDEMSLRGPDADGFYFDDYIGLGHRRLAIIDLSELGRQPMFDRERKYCVVFNGEIYNYQELKKELSALGAEFRTHSDTEIILEGYKYWGVDCVKKFNGMFAFALWDIENKALFISRDRLGKKPLFYYQLSDGGIVFSSELKAILHEPEIKKRLSLDAVNQYLSLGYILTDSAIIKGVKKLPPAHSLLIKQNESPKIWEYWQLEKFFDKKIKIEEEEAAKHLKNLIDDAVKLRMISDVPLGAFLSGGLDSSSIVAAMAAQKNPLDVKTFSIGFKEKSYSELPEAELVANILKVSHKQKVVDLQMAEILPEIVRLADEPFADNSMIPTYYLSQYAREYVTVAIAGDGGDEMFAGYETYNADKLYRYLNCFPKPVLNLFSKIATGLIPTSFDKVSFDFKIKKFLSGCALPFAEAHYSWREIFSDQDKSQLVPKKYLSELKTPLAKNQFVHFFKKVSSAHQIDQAMYVDLKTWLVNDILVKADRMSMATSLELRAPLLDYRIAEFAATLPVNLKLNGFTKKYILKKSQEGVLPNKIIYRKKMGFNAPVAHWLTNGLEKTFSNLQKDNLLFSEIISSEQINKMLEEHRSKKLDNSFKLFTLLNLGLWLKQYPDLMIDN